MRVKRKLNARGVERIKGLTSKELADKCPDTRSVFPISPCTNSGCEYAIKNPGYMNCTFVAAQVSEHTLEEIGDMMGVSREGIRKIEERALRKVREAMDKLQDEQAATIYKQELAPGKGHLDPNGKDPELKNKPDSIPTHCNRELAQCGR